METNKNFNINDILVSTWGWEQTNVTFYQVLKVTPKSVKVAKIDKHTVMNNQYLTGVNTPLVGYFIDKPITRRVKSYGANLLINISDYASAELWNGKEVQSTHYA